MQIKLFAAFCVLSIACQQPEKTAPIASNPDSSTVAAEPLDMKGYTATYSSSFEVGNSKNVTSLMTVFKDYDSAALDSHLDLYADTFAVTMADGSYQRDATANILKGVNDYRKSLKAFSQTISAVMPVRTTDTKDEWVIVWSRERNTRQNGSVDSTDLQETWHFNKENKIDMLLQYSRPAAAPKK